MRDRHSDSSRRPSNTKVAMSDGRWRWREQRRGTSQERYAGGGGGEGRRTTIRHHQPHLPWTMGISTRAARRRHLRRRYRRRRRPELRTTVRPTTRGAVRASPRGPRLCQRWRRCTRSRHRRTPPSPSAYASSCTSTLGIHRLVPYSLFHASKQCWFRSLPFWPLKANKVTELIPT